MTASATPDGPSETATPAHYAPAASGRTPTPLAQQAADTIRQRSGVSGIDRAVVLGSGWGASADRLGTTLATLPAAEVPGFHVSGVPGHAGTLQIVQTASGRRVLLIAARTHLYEGHGVDAVVHGVHTAAALGAGSIVLTNGCGGIDPSLAPGSPVLISDHVNLTGTSPLSGPTFVDMTDVYSPRLRAAVRERHPQMREGVYAQFRGPQYETPAEVRMARAIGADLVGMSTALEAIAARALGLEVLGLSLVTNAAAGVSAQPLSHAEVIQAGRDAAPQLTELLAEILENIV
ncbi:MAG: purine-nucleoside phosphorylase [Pseudoclavibacter sp.]